MSVLDGSLNVITSRFYSGTAPRYEAVTLDFSSDAPQGEYVEVKLGSPDCLSLSEVEVFGYSIMPPAINLARRSGTVATQSTMCWNGWPGRGIDGNRHQYWAGNSITHTCNENQPWWMVDLGAGDQYMIDKVSVYNRWDDCCRSVLTDSQVQVLDESKNVVASHSIGAGEVSPVYNFDFGNAGGRYIRVIKNGSGSVQVVEIVVMGWVV